MAHEVTASCGHAELVAIVRQLLLALPPRQQVIAIVGVRVGARYAQIADPQFLGHVREHAELEIPAIGRRSVAVRAPHELAPPRRGEAHVDVRIDPLTMQRFVLQHRIECVQQRADRVCRIPFERTSDTHHDRTVRLKVLPEQRQIVAAAERTDRRTALAQRLQVAFRREQLPDRSGDSRLIGFVGKDVDNAVEQAYEVFDLITLFALNGVQLVACALVDGTHAPDKYVGEIVAGAYTRAVEQRDDQCVALLGQSVVPERGRVERHRLIGERAQLRGRNPGDGQ
ncbi:hypothetical protein OKW34_004142 [Paraburkholderia youngii]